MIAANTVDAHHYTKEVRRNPSQCDQVRHVRQHGRKNAGTHCAHNCENIQRLFTKITIATGRNKVADTPVAAAVPLNALNSLANGAVKKNVCSPAAGSDERSRCLGNPWTLSAG